MRPIRQVSAFLAVLLAGVASPGLARAQARAGAWLAYRDAYRAMVVFEKYGGPKDFLQSELEVQVRAPGASLDGAQLVLSGKSMQLNLPLDPLGRTVFPLHKAAYDENAALILNRKGLASPRDFALRPRVTIALRADGVYDTAELRSACAEALAFARYLDASQRARRCAGVRFVFAKQADGGARLRQAGGRDLPLPVREGAAFPGDLDDAFPIATYRFGADAGHALVTSYNAPLAIVPLFE